ncbi:signal peptidase II [Rarobacter incanus]|uniref:Lipoprotein signal peptidase n=1 Tax=Rarobacter incanus TaxID=153494 RepID=A0A542SLJ8_9MICO|nr:signal peptidase II [Rarobacter incanus]TQK75506.1 signal peptidase II [Rarobacter incanus]
MKSRWGASLTLFGIAAITVVIDQLTKVWALAALSHRGERISLIGDLLGLRLVFNPGAALSLGASSTWIITVIAVAITVGVVLTARRVGNRAWAIALGLLLGGALGNVIDRLFRAPGFGRGHVVDFIDYGIFVGNVADIALVVAALAVAYLNLRRVPLGRSPQQ